MRIATPHNPGEVTTHTGQKAYEKVLAYVGASLVRDTIDKRIIHEVSTGTATYMTGGNGSINGIIDTQSAAGGWPVLNSLPAPIDTDADGMPDAWEDTKGLNKANPSDAQLTTVDGIYPNVEVYLNSLVASITENELKDGLYTAAQAIQKTVDPVKIYLDNSSGLLQISHQQTFNRLKIYSITGALMKTKNCNSTHEELQVNDLCAGVYIVSVSDNKGEVYSEKIVKRK